MFIRETIKKVKGKSYIHHKLVESVRTPSGPRQRIVLNLGTLDFPKEKWKELANAVESELHGEHYILPLDPEIEGLAKHYSELIIKERLKNKQEGPEAKKQPPDYENVDLNTITLSDSRTVGCEHIVLNQLEEYKFDDILQKLNFEKKHIDYAKMLIVGRLVHPSSERETARWIDEDSSTIELLNSKKKVYDNALHRTAVMLFDGHDQIEQSLSDIERDLFSLEETIILYDLTNTYFEGSKMHSQIAKHSKKSKDKRDDRPLVTLALTIDSDGFPKQSKILSGNISEPKTLKKILDDLQNVTAGYNEVKTIVIDAGIASEDNLEIIKNQGFNYVAVSRKQSYPKDFWVNGKEKEIKLSDGKTILRTKLMQTKDEAFLKCHSPMKEKKEKKILARKLLKFEEGLSHLNKGLNKKHTSKKYDKVIERIGRLKEKYGVGTLYDIEVEKCEEIATKINYSKNSNGQAKEQKVGEYILRTSHIEFGEKEISTIHRTLTTVEDSFRSIKSHLGLRPIHHKRDDTSTAHIFISVIAYHVMIGILKKLQIAGIHYNWSTVRNILQSHTRVTTSLKTDKEMTIHIRTCTNPTIKQKLIYDALKVNQQPLKRTKTEIPIKITGKNNL